MKNILLIGNPNTGKTTLFNALTNSNEKVGNWNGVTNNYAIKKMKGHEQEYNVVDLPGTYSLTPFTYEEKVTVDFLYADKHKSLALCVCEIDALQKNLFLALELLEYGQDMMVVINNKNKEKLRKIDVAKLSGALGVNVFLVDFSNKTEMEELKNNILSHQAKTQNFFPSYLQNYLAKYSVFVEMENFNKTYVLTKLLEQDEYFLQKTTLQIPDKMEEICFSRHSFISNINCITKTKKKTTIEKIDNIILNKYLAIPIFLAVMLLIFYLTFFSLGAFLSDALEQAVLSLGREFTNVLSKLVKTKFILNFFSQGVFSAFAIVTKFLPQVILLFFFLNLIEQSGYLSRVAFIFEDILSKFGLSGKSIYTVLMGFGCSVPAIMTSRTVASEKTKIKTAILTPYMSCSAKIPIYAVLGGAFFGNYNVFVILLLYIIGMAVGFLVAFALEKTLLKSNKKDFILEFTNLQTVKAKQMVKNIVQSAKEFFSRVFVLIICSNIVIWVISSFSFNMSYVGDALTQNGNFFSKSMLQVLSELLFPIFKPLGFTSYVHISALVTGLIAKEIVVSTLALYNSFTSSEGLSKQFKNVESLIYFSPASAFSYLIFVLIYPPCFASIGMLKKEIGKKWTIFAVLVQFVLAYVLSFVAYRLYTLFQVTTLELILLIVILFVFAISLKFLFFKKDCSFCTKNCKKCK